MQQGLLLKAKAKDLTLKAKDSKFVLEDTSRPRTKAKDNNTDRKSYALYRMVTLRLPTECPLTTPNHPIFCFLHRHS